MTLKGNGLRRNIQECMQRILFRTKKTNWSEVKHFHPEGKSMPNGSHYQRGGFLYECRQNKSSFVLDKGVHMNQYGMVDCKGGIIVFSNDANLAELDREKLLNRIGQVLATFKNGSNNECAGAYSVGHFFKGKYVGNNGATYDAKSLAVEIEGLSSESLLNVAEMLAREFMQESILANDLCKNKIYLADFIR